MRRTLARLQAPTRLPSTTDGFVPDDVLTVLQNSVRLYGSQAQTLYENNRSRFRLLDLDATGTPAIPVTSFDQMIVSSVSESLKDRIQLMSSSDAQKMYTFGEEHRILMVEMVLIDTNSGTTVVGDYDRWTGATFRSWESFYEKARISECAKNSQLVEFRYGGSLLYGAMLSENVLFNAQNPNQLRVSISMIVSASF
jgi:hypothetical protein